jgi:outer membrane protein OmpA-like peptidoglycan-associated protein
MHLSTPNDPFEREAERVADQITHTGYVERPTEPLITALPTMPRSKRQALNRNGEDVNNGTRVPNESDETDGETQSDPHSATGLLQHVEALRCGGQSLAEPVRHSFEKRFGREFGHVRVDTSVAAASAARSMNAKAFTVGSYIAFGSGQFAPGTERGDRLLAHELTHTVQQAPGKSVQLSRQSGADVDSLVSSEEAGSVRGLVMRQVADAALPAGRVASRRRPLVIQRDFDDQAIADSAGEVSDRKSEITWSKSSPGVTAALTPGEDFVVTNFAIGSADLKKEHEEFLRDVVYFGTLTSDPMATIVVVGHTDSTGSATFNERLANKRAKAVAAELRKLGEHLVRIDNVSGRGAKVPLSSNDTVLGRADNRRVEILVKPFKPTTPLPTLLGDLAKGMKPFVVRVENFSACPFPDTVKKVVEDGFKPVPLIQFDWDGKSTSPDAFITFDDTATFTEALALSGDIFLNSFRNNEICKTPGVSSTCEKAFPERADVMGHAIGNTVAHETGHSMALDHVPSTDNFMWSPELHPLSKKVNKTFDDKVLLQRTLQAVPETFNASQLIHMLIRIKEKRKAKKGTITFE